MTTDRLSRAFALAEELHRDQTRKGSDVPYVAHLMAVAGIVAEFGGDEAQTVAALLHDAVEDQGGEETLRRIRWSFGERVARLVLGCSDATTTPKPPYWQRKQSFIRDARQAPPDLKLIIAADKIHNLRSLRRDFRKCGPALWERFTKGREGILWYHKELAAALCDGWDHPICEELREATEALLKEAGET